MNTPAHLILGIAAFGKPDQPRVNAAAAFGALAPDVSLYLLVAGAMVLSETPDRIFGELYFSEAWQAVFRIDNSVFVWGAVLLSGVALRRDWMIAMGAAALLHLACDLPLHHDDGRAHFWPLTNWVFESPVSYWDVRRGAGWIAPLEVALALAAAAWAAWRFPSPWVRLILAAAVVGQLSVNGLWAWIFA
ncbi:hypothetical protein [Jannaschia aquimarina]|uniref:Cobalamin biosynthesis protein CobQ n=1 Tax=Jannaschia aquimarina TaxID=935700 RepID=A0A0D1CNJ3_9RHOB|nr:hypothetical protein [Jannaschia aquimarina]KIT16287.1 hypothetical protein jaqu_20420 [Jannaschia aquimarina]SNT14572.1 hypothetical protein SAMN05421775_106183 [Jannaschia aquimarina]